MTASEFAKVQEDVECEGFFNAFFSYDDYSWVQDPDFHYLRNNLITAAKHLATYVGVDPKSL